MHSSDSDSDSDWNRELFFAVSKKQGNGPKISEQDRCGQMRDCLVRGADINSMDKNGNTVLHIAVKKDYQEVVRFLRHEGATTDIRNKRDYTAVMLAEDLGNNEIVSILTNSVQQQSKQAITGGQLKSIDNEKPITSGESSLRMQDSSSSPVSQSPKRKLNTDNEYDGKVKKKLLVPSNTSQRERRRDSTVDTGDADSGGTSLGEDLYPKKKEDRTIQTVHFDPKETYAASGLKRTLHGVVYQWKHLMLVMNRAWKMGYSFRLSTEMDAAEKFDDLVLEYLDGEGNKMHRFVQVKHKKDNTKMIAARDLLDVNDGEFSVLKYFISWRTIKKRSVFDASVSKTFTLCTNIGLDVEGLKEANIDVVAVQESDDFLKVRSKIEQPPRYKLQMGKRSELYDTLKSASDFHRLARELADRVHGSKDIYLNTEIIRRYHAALAQEVIDIKNQKFFRDFIKNNNLSVKAKNFRETFLLHFKTLLRGHATEPDIWKRLEEKKLKLSTTFGRRFELDITPKLIHVGRFSQEFVKLVNKASHDNVVKIDRRIYSKRASDQSIERVVGDNIDKLAGHVLVTENGKIKFRLQFLNNDGQLMGNIKKFKDALKAQLGNKFDKLGEFEFEINNFKTCTEEELSSSAELPNDDIDDGEISDFLNGFILAVNQPDESELGEMIKDEIGDSQVNLPDAKFITDSYQMKILDWFKETGKQSVFLANENAQKIFNEIEGRLSSLITTDLRLEYPENLKKWGIRFEHENTELQKFVQSPHGTLNQILVISSKQSLLTALRVHQTLIPLQNIKGNDGFIFVRLERLLETNIMDQVLRAFKWRRNHNLLVLDCESIILQQYTQELWDPLCEIIKENDEKKMILISQGNNYSGIHFEISYKTLPENDHDISIDNLKKCSQQKLLEQKVVKFQGQAETFGRIIGIHDFDDIGVQKLKDLKRIISLNTLVQLVKGKEIHIGSEVEGLGTIQDYYIPRIIVRHVVIKGDILNAPKITDLFAIGGVSGKTLKKLLLDKGKLRSFNDISRTEPHLNKCIILGSGKEADQFKELYQRHLDHNIHWLQGESGKLIWMQSVGDISNLMAHEDESRSDDGDDRSVVTYLTEDELVDHDKQHRIVIVSDTAGMGKSTVLTSVARKMKGNESSLLVIRINLTQHTTSLAEEKMNRTFNSNNPNGAVDFLVDKLLRLQTDLESQVYKTIIKYRGEAALLFDGFDEISPTYKDIVIGLLQALVKLPIKKLFVTTRPYTKKDLEEKLGTFSYRLQQFSKYDQIEFLIKFWKQGLSGNKCNVALEGCLEMHAERVMNLLAKSISDQMTEFTGVPLQTRMVAEVYQYGRAQKREHADETEEITESDEDEAMLPETIDIIDLYKQFVNKKYHIFFEEKQSGDCTNPAAMQGHNIGQQIFFRTHQKFALDALFNEETARALLLSQPEVKGCLELCWGINESGERTGLVTPNVDGKPQFIHRTFAEYFAATFLITTLEDNNRNQELQEFFITVLFVDPQYKTIRAFLNCLLSGIVYDIENRSWKLDLRKYHNAGDETLYHIAAVECNVEIVKFFLNRLSENSEGNSKEQEASINFQDWYGRTPLGIAIEKAYNLDVVKYFVEGGASIHVKSTDDTVLHIAVQKPNYLDVVKYLCDKGASIDCLEKACTTPLHFAVAVTGNLDVVKYLCDKVASIDCRNKDYQTPLYYAATNTNNLDVVKYLCDQGANISCQDIIGRTPLHVAADMAGNLDIVKFLCDKGAESDCQANNGRTPLHYTAAKAGNLTVVKYFCDKGANINCPDSNGKTPLHYATETADNLDIVKYLCNKGANINRQEISGTTPLHYAVDMADNLDTVEYLCNEGANINCEDNDGWTPLHAAACKGSNLDVVKYLCGKGASSNCQENNGRTPLHFAARVSSNLDAVKYFYNKGADVNCQDKNGRTPLHYAVETLNNLDTVVYLCHKGANINCPDKSGSTPLHSVTTNANNLDVVKYLCEKGADINIQTHDGFTPLHKVTAQASLLDFADYLRDESDDTNCQQEDGSTPPHSPTLNVQKLDIVKYLINKGAIINTQTKDGRTPLHSAANSLQLDVVKFLLQKGANANLKDKDGKTPLTTAISRYGDSNTLQNLFRNHVNANI